MLMLVGVFALLRGLNVTGFLCVTPLLMYLVPDLRGARRASASRSIALALLGVAAGIGLALAGAG
jgi:hypothetical protein